MGIQGKLSPPPRLLVPQFFYKGTIVNGLLYFLQRDSMQIHTSKAYCIHCFAHCFFPPASPHDLGDCAILVRRNLPCWFQRLHSIPFYALTVIYKSSVDGHLVCFQSLAVIHFLVQTFGALVCIYLKNKSLDMRLLVRGYMHFKIWKISPHFPLFSFTVPPCQTSGIKSWSLTIC